MKSLRTIARTRHIWTATLTEFKRIWNDKPSFIAYVLGGPVILATIIGFAAYRSPQPLEIAVFVNRSSPSPAGANDSTEQLIQDLGSSGVLSVAEVPSLDDGWNRLDQGDARAFVILEEGATGLEGVGVTLDISSNPMVQQAAYNALRDGLEKWSRDITFKRLIENGVPAEEAVQIASPLDLEWITNEHTHIKFFDSYASGSIVVVVLGFSVLYSCTAITSERSRGTIERLFVTPYTKTEIVAGKLIAQSVFAVLAAMLCVATLAIVHHVALDNIFLVMVIAGLVGINGVIIGLVISSFTYREAQSMLVAVVTFIGIIFLMGFIWPPESMHPVAKYISSAIPFTYATGAIRQLNLVGAGFSDVWQDFVILTGSVIVLAALATLILRREIR